MSLVESDHCSYLLMYFEIDAQSYQVWMPTIEYQDFYCSNISKQLSDLERFWKTWMAKTWNLTPRVKDCWTKNLLTDWYGECLISISHSLVVTIPTGARFRATCVVFSKLPNKSLPKILGESTNQHWFKHWIRCLNQLLLRLKKLRAYPSSKDGNGENTRPLEASDGTHPADPQADPMRMMTTKNEQQISMKERRHLKGFQTPFFSA